MKIFVIGGLTSRNEDVVTPEAATLEETCRQIGRSLVEAGHDLVLCSPFDDAADIHVLRGAASVEKGKNTRVEFHFVDTETTRNRVDAVVAQLGLTSVSKVPHPPAQPDDESGGRYAWLLCQLNALESGHATVAIGGSPNGAANMLLLLAEGKRKPVLPFPFLGGAAKLAFERRRYELQDRIEASKFSLLHDKSATELVGAYVAMLTSEPSVGNQTLLNEPRFFISYSRERQAEADHVETLLRRRGMRVFRDESDFGAGHSVSGEIKEAIFNANVFIALWSTEYACSPWCFDELELALDRSASGKLSLWILRVDKARIVPVRARQLISYETHTREELEGKILFLIDRLNRSEKV